MKKVNISITISIIFLIALAFIISSTRTTAGEEMKGRIIKVVPPCSILDRATGKWIEATNGMPVSTNRPPQDRQRRLAGHGDR